MKKLKNKGKGPKQYGWRLVQWVQWGHVKGSVDSNKCLLGKELARCCPHCTQGFIKKSFFINVNAFTLIISENAETLGTVGTEPPKSFPYKELQCPHPSSRVHTVPIAIAITHNKSCPLSPITSRSSLKSLSPYPIPYPTKTYTPSYARTMPTFLSLENSLTPVKLRDESFVTRPSAYRSRLYSPYRLPYPYSHKRYTLYPLVGLSASPRCCPTALLREHSPSSTALTAPASPRLLSTAL